MLLKRLTFPLLAVLVVLAIALSVVPAAAQAKYVACGHVTIEGGARFSVGRISGRVSCKTARHVAWKSEENMDLPKGWRCTLVLLGANYDEYTRCRSRAGTLLIHNIYSPPAPPTPPKPPPPPPSPSVCAEFTVKSGIYTAGGSALGNTCAKAKEVAVAFVESPECALNFTSKYDYDCTAVGHHCVGELLTARESLIDCGSEEVYFQTLTAKVYFKVTW
jgi:hypothetical protein